VTVNDLITAALRRLRVISGSDPPDGDSITDALARLNDWIDDLKTQDFTLWARTRTTWALTPGVGTYAIGVGAAINVARPTNPDALENVGYLDAGGNERLLPTPLTEDAWAAIPFKTQLGTFPQYVYYNPTVPTGTLAIWPVPSAPLTGVVYSGLGLDEVTINQTLIVPPGYRRFLRDGLALELAAEFHVSDPGVIGPLQQSAQDAMRNIKRKNRRLYDLAAPAEFGGYSGGNIYTGP
jgi:hypothetical protein